MKHQKAGKKFHRKNGPRKALLKSLAENLVLKGKIKTTELKAKELRIFIEKKITTAKKADISARRMLKKYFSDETVKKLIDEIGPSLKERKGGYTRITKLGVRKKDNTKMAMIEIIKREAK